MAINWFHGYRQTTCHLSGFCNHILCSGSCCRCRVPCGKWGEPWVGRFNVVTCSDCHYLVSCFQSIECNISHKLNLLLGEPVERPVKDQCFQRHLRVQSIKCNGPEKGKKYQSAATVLALHYIYTRQGILFNRQLCLFLNFATVPYLRWCRRESVKNEPTVPIISRYEHAKIYI